MSKRQRLIEIQAADVVPAAGDLASFASSTWLLGGHAEPDNMALSNRWIATEFSPAPSYHATGYPLLSWNGTAWVAV